MPRERTIQSLAHKALACTVYPREHNKDSQFWIVVCHGVLCSRKHSLIRKLAERCSEHFHVLTFDFHDNGDSEESREQWSLGAYIEEAEEDLEAVVQQLRTEGGEVAGIVGHSRGANVVLLHAARFDSVPFVISLSGRFDSSEGLDSYFLPGDRAKLESQEVKEVPMVQPVSDGVKRKVRLADLKARLALDYRVLRSVSRTKCFWLVHGESDETVPVKDVEQIAAQIGVEKRVKTFANMNHDMRVQGSLDPLFSWLKKEVWEVIEGRLFEEIKFESSEK